MIRFPPSPGDQGLLPIWCHFKTMLVYYDKNENPNHTRYFRKIASHLPAVLFLPNAVWLEIVDSS